MTDTKLDLPAILAGHKKWLRDEKGGECANLSGADLSGANLYGANLYRDAGDYEKAINCGDRARAVLAPPTTNDEPNA